MAIKGSVSTNQTITKNKPSARDVLSDTQTKLSQYLLDKIQEEQQLPWDNPVHQDIPFSHYNPITGTTYKGSNTIRLYVSALENGYKDPRWVTFNSIAGNEDYKLSKGSKGTKVEFYKHIPYGTDEWDKYTAKWSEDRKQQYKASERDIIIHTYSTVFNADQFDKFPPLEKISTLIIPEEDRVKAIEEIIANSEAPITYDGRGRNYYKPSTDTIHLTKQEYFKSKEAFYSTALHEIAHSTGHESRLNRPLKPRDPSNPQNIEHYAAEELVAEFSSVLLRERFNVTKTKEQVQNSLSYVQNWAEAFKKDPNIILRSMKEAEKAVNYIQSNMLVNYKTNQKTIFNELTELPQTISKAKDNYFKQGPILTTVPANNSNNDSVKFDKIQMKQNKSKPEKSAFIDFSR